MAEGKGSSFANLEVNGDTVIEANRSSGTAIAVGSLASYGTNAVLLLVVGNTAGVERIACDFVEALVFAVGSSIVGSI